jgi:AcrR family transcriptional regulator
VVKERALRADAERNRRRVLEVAQEVFSTEGLAVPIDEIARRAGLGVGTLYRHFPTKEALFAAIVVTRMEDVTAEARAQHETDAPGEAFFTFLVRMIDGWRQKKDFIDALTSAGADLEGVARAKHDLHRELGKLLERAQKIGAVREDVSIKEILALVAGAIGALDRHGISTKGRDRMLAIIFDGLRGQPKAVTRTRSSRRGGRPGPAP